MVGKPDVWCPIWGVGSEVGPGRSGVRQRGLEAKRTDLATSKSKIIEFKVIRTKENKEKYFIIIQITY